MNWYKKAFPIVEDPERLNMYGYMGVGHRGKASQNILWIIDNNFNLETISEQELIERTGLSSVTHAHWNEAMRKRNHILAKGRYDQQFDEVSLVLNRPIIYEKINIENEGNSDGRINYIEERIVKILDKTFNNPVIRRF